MFRMLLPRAYGGAEIEPLSYVRAIETIAGADASTAWCMNQASGGSMCTAYLKPEVASKIFGPRDAVVSWGPGVGKAMAVDGGYRISGSWAFASGGPHATGIGGRRQG